MKSFMKTLAFEGKAYAPLPFKRYRLEPQEIHWATFDLMQLQNQGFSWTQILSLQWRCHITNRNLIFEQREVPGWQKKVEAFLPQLASLIPGTPAGYSLYCKRMQKEAKSIVESYRENKLGFIVPIHEVQSVSPLGIFKGGTPQDVTMTISEEYNFLPEYYAGFYIAPGAENFKRLSFIERAKSSFYSAKDFIKIIERLQNK